MAIESAAVPADLAPYRPQTPWTVPTALLAVAVILVVAGIAAFGGLKLVQRLSGLGSAPGDQSMQAVIWLGWSQVFTVLLTTLAARRFGGQASRVLALGPPAHGLRDYGQALILMAALLGVFNLLVYALFPVDLLADLRAFTDIVRHPAWLVGLVVIAVGAPLSEELLFRGFLQSALARSRIGYWWGALLGTALWTALHAGYSLLGIAEVALIGLYLSWVLRRTGSLRVPIVCHAIYNGVLTLGLRYLPI